MTTGQTPEPETPMEEATEEAGGVSGMVNLTINLPDNIRISTVDSDEEETTVSNGNTTGMIQIFAGPTAPAGWLLCNGAAVSRATYSDLFDVIGTRYGVGNANTTFNLPDLRGRFPLGKDDMGEVSADRVASAEADELGGNGGAENHALTLEQTPTHGHALLAGEANVPGGGPGGDVRWPGPARGSEHGMKRVKFEVNEGTRTRPYARYQVSAGINGSGYQSSEYPPFVSPVGDSQSHNNMPPYQTLNYIIKT
ncbi:MAG: tail fiber protein [Anaerolineaceae bacterium]|nr:tail fiber protein [Anaerolineaceae bacterium]